MIQFYDERPADPLDAFVWFEDLFRRQFLTGSSPAPTMVTAPAPDKDPSVDGMREYVFRLLIVKRELATDRGAGERIMAAVIPYWDFWTYSPDEFENKVHARFGSNFNESIFRRFEKDVFSLLAKLKHGRNI